MDVPPIQQTNLTNFRRFGCRLPTRNLQRRNRLRNSKNLRCGLAREPPEAGQVR
jgi:hypothetical protein